MLGVKKKRRRGKRYETYPEQLREQAHRNSLPAPSVEICYQKSPEYSPVDWRTIADDKEKYNAYLCSPEWGRLRAAVHERAGGICERCKIWSIDAVHHVSYARKYLEELEDLAGECKWCHEFTHGLGKWDFAGPYQTLGRYFAYCLKTKRDAWAVDSEGQPDNDPDQAITRAIIRSLYVMSQSIGSNKLMCAYDTAICDLDESLPYVYRWHAAPDGVPATIPDYYELASLLGVECECGRQQEE